MLQKKSGKRYTALEVIYSRNNIESFNRVYNLGYFLFEYVKECALALNISIYLESGNIVKSYTI